MAIKVLVAVYKYSDKDFVHPRNIYYKKSGIDVTVLDFDTKKDSNIDGIKTICLESFYKKKESYDILISHAPNIRNHFWFLVRNEKKFRKLLFFFHGHEVLRGSKVYSKPYSYMKNSKIKAKLMDIYDILKLYLWRVYLCRLAYKSKFVFVSNWMMREFFKWTKIPFDKIRDSCFVTYNCVGVEFEEKNYDYKAFKKYDFVSIRSNLDGSKYCIDLINELAFANPLLNFLIIGKGNFFDFNEKAPNIILIKDTYTHDEIVKILQKARCGLMPTRTDAQGVMMCEMATLGIPVITSDLPVCHEVLDSFANVRYIDLNNNNTNLESLLEDIEANEPFKKNDKYFSCNTSKKEVELIKFLG